MRESVAMLAMLLDLLERNRSAIGLVCLLASCHGLGPFCIPTLAEESDLSAHLSVRPDASPREMLGLLGMGDDFFAGFASGEPLDDAERDKLLRLMFRLGQMSKAVLETHANPPLDVTRIGDDPGARQGEIFNLRLNVLRVDRIDVPPDLREKFGFEHYYKCQVDASGQPATLYALRVPSAWKLERAIDENGETLAMFIKELPSVVRPPAENVNEQNVDGPASKDVSSQFLFVADRVAWHPPTMLGRLGMDYGLFDEVRDRSKLTEREAFYTLLAITRTVSPALLDRNTRQLFEKQNEELQRVIRNPDVSAKMRAEAERAWERVQQGATDVVPLFNDPAGQRGRFVVLRGEALRAVKVRVDDVDVVKRFGIDHYYEIEIITPDSQNNPIVCCVTAVPPNMPLGDAIHEDVRVAGFFLKSWAFDTRKSNSKVEQGSQRARQLAPLVIGKRVELLTRPRIGAPTQSITLAAALLIVFVVVGVAMWLIRRSDRRALRQMAEHRGSLPEQLAVDRTKSKTANDS